MLKIETSVKGDWRRLSASRWLAGVEGVIEDLRTARFVQPAMLLRETAHLLAAAPQPLAAWLGPVADIEALEAMLAAQAEESFALALIPPQVGYMLSRGPNGVNLATVIMPGPEQEKYTAEGETAAIALLAAFVTALRAAAGQILAEVETERLN